MTLTAKLAHEHGATHKANLGVYQFYEYEWVNYNNALVEVVVEALEDLRGYSGVGADGNPLCTHSWNAALKAAEQVIKERICGTV